MYLLSTFVIFYIISITSKYNLNNVVSEFFNSFDSHFSNVFSTNSTRDNIIGYAISKVVNESDVKQTNPFPSSIVMIL